jgi:hypothetical protein
MGALDRFNTVVDIDHGFHAIMAELASFKHMSVKIGIQDDAEAEADGTPMVLVGAVNEFGTHDGRIPERSWLRSTADEKREKWNLGISNGLKTIIDQLHGVSSGEKVLTAAVHGTTLSSLLTASVGAGAKARHLLKLVGEAAKADIQAKIRSNVPPPNAPSTIAQKGSSKTLIDTGAMLRSIDYKVEG